MDDILYKYRALEPWEYLLDILVNQRLFAAQFQTLNDPMEGVFTYSQDGVNPSFIQQMVDHKASLGICSLSEVYDSTVMWSYYAAAHRGLVLGLTIDRSSIDVVEVSRVRYDESNVFRGFLGSEPDVEARKVLSKKLPAWRHEREVRAFSRSQFVPITLKGVYFVCLMPMRQRDLLRSILRFVDNTLPIIDVGREDLDSRLYDGVI